jgi:FlaA1/EpsC-like NDP-sugar epimerase
MYKTFTRERLLTKPRWIKQLIVIGVDLLIAWVAVLLAVNLLYQSLVPIGITHLWLFLISVAVILPLFVTSGLYRAIFRYAGLQVIFSLSKALAVYSSLYILVFTLVGVPGVPRSLGLTQPMFFTILVMSSRIFARHWLGGMGLKARLKLASRVLIYGAGSAGRQLANSIVQSQDLVVVGFVDDDVGLQGHSLNGLTIYGPQNLAQLVADKHVLEIHLALPSVSRKRRNEIIETLKPLSVKVLTLPSFYDITSGKIALADLQELELEDLLGREPVPPNNLLITKNTTFKVVLVTGAGGSIGAELCRQILKFKPARLLLLELSEFALYSLEQDLQKLLHAEGGDVELVPLLADVRNSNHMAEIIRTWRPHVVYHAAAYKHVPLVEHNPAEGIRNNVLGTWVIAEQAIAYGVSDFVLISTDKAVRPTNIMGASKRLAEMVLQAIANRSLQSKTRFSMVRFGNVLGSSGSVVPLFRQQILRGGPITLTDTRVTRYFMSITEAAQLVIQSGAMANGGDVFVLDMGESVKIIDLARRMIHLSGLNVRDETNPDGDIAIEVTGLRPGEKLFEELLIGNNPLPTEHPRILKAHEEYLPWSELQEQIVQLMQEVEVNNIPAMRARIQQLVPGFHPDAEIADWIWQAQATTAECKD